MTISSHGNWITLQCAKWGCVTFGKDSLKAIFLANDRNLLKYLKEYCFGKKSKDECEQDPVTVYFSNEFQT